MELEILFREIELQEKMAERVMSVLPVLSGEEIETQLKCLMNIKTAPDALAHLTALFPDEDGVGVLACSLLCACKAYKEYQKKGISDTVYFETMKCFTRFIDETQNGRGDLPLTVAGGRIVRSACSYLELASLNTSLWNMKEDPRCRYIFRRTHISAESLWASRFLRRAPFLVVIIRNTRTASTSATHGFCRRSFRSF